RGPAAAATGGDPGGRGAAAARRAAARPDLADPRLDTTRMASVAGRGTTRRLVNSDWPAPGSSQRALAVSALTPSAVRFGAAGGSAARRGSPGSPARVR